MREGITIEGCQNERINFQDLMNFKNTAEQEGNHEVAAILEQVIKSSFPWAFQHEDSEHPKHDDKDMLSKPAYNEDEKQSERRKFMGGDSEGFFNRINIIIGMIGVVMAMIAFFFNAVSSNNAATLAAVQATNQSGVDKMNSIAADINTNLVEVDTKIDATNTHIQSLESSIDQKLELHDTQNELKTLEMIQEKKK